MVAERWLSGLRHTPGKRAWLIPTEGSNPSLSASFPSPLRQSTPEIVFDVPPSSQSGRLLAKSSGAKKEGERLTLYFPPHFSVGGGGGFPLDRRTMR